MKRLSPLTHRRYLVPLVLVTLLFFLWGFARAILDVLNKHLQNQMDISITQSSLIQVTTYLGYFLMAIPAVFGSGLLEAIKAVKNYKTDAMFPGWGRPS